MSLKDFIGKSGEQDEAGGSLERPLAVPRSVAPATSVDANTRITGKIICKETLRIDGRVKGEVRCDKTVIIGEQAFPERLSHVSATRNQDSRHCDSLSPISGESKGFACGDGTSSVPSGHRSYTTGRVYRHTPFENRR